MEGERHEEVSFVEATTWGKLATVCAEHLGKGRGVRVVGRTGQERWEDGDGNPRAKVVIVAEHVEFQPGWHRRLHAAGATPDLLPLHGWGGYLAAVDILEFAPAMMAGGMLFYLCWRTRRSMQPTTPPQRRVTDRTTS